MTAADIDVPDDETLYERRHRFLTLRNAQMTFRAIAEQHNRTAVKAATDAGLDPDEAKTISPATVRKDIERARRELTSDATRESLVAQEYSVIMDMRRASYQAALGGDVDAIKLIINTSRDVRELFGLDAPKRTQIGVGTDVEFARELSDLIAAIGGAVPNELAFAAGGEHTALDAAPDAAADGSSSPDSALDVDVIPLDVHSPEPAPRRSASDALRSRGRRAATTDDVEPETTTADEPDPGPPAAAPWSNL